MIIISGHFLFEKIARDLSDVVVGWIVLVFALGMLICCLIAIVKLLHSLLRVSVDENNGQTLKK